jgi:hypothetical protein
MFFPVFVVVLAFLIKRGKEQKRENIGQWAYQFWVVFKFKISTKMGRKT